MEIVELQRLFYDAIFSTDITQKQEACKHIKAAKYLKEIECLAIYRGSIVGKLSRSLTSTYPVCCRLVGDEFFEATAVTYIRRFPSLSPDLGDYGEQFPDFLANFEPVATLPYLPDVARLEWYWHRVFKGEDTTGLDLQKLSEIPQDKWGELIFHLPKNSFLLESPYPIHRIWEVNQPDYQGNEEVNLDEGAIKIFLWRQDYDMRIDLPNDAEWQLLKAFQGKNTFEIICENLVTNEPTIHVSSLLPLFVQRGWITDFSI